MRAAAWAAAVGLGMATIATAPARANDLDVAIGKTLFERNWIPAPASTKADDGLGPLFNARSCAGCHAAAGPARFAVPNEGRMITRGVVVRLATAAGAPDPYYGAQIQDRAVPGLPAEGELTVTTAPPPIAEATAAPPLAWKLHLAGPPLAPGVRAGLRQAPSLAGRGDLGRIDPHAILALADPDDQNGDGISGRPRFVAGTPPGEAPRLGRFGWKAGVPDLPAQVASAFALDMGLSSRPTPRPYGDCTPYQAACLAAPTGARDGSDDAELADDILRLTAAFAASRRARALPTDAPGLAVFRRAGCDACHVPMLPDTAGVPIVAFTDLLLHDMGAELDDGLGEPGVASYEWRTAPLIDLAPRNSSRRYLHDGRAADLAAAIAAHGGEAATARVRFAALTADERALLLEFLKGR